PFSRPLGTAMLLAEAIEAAGLTPVIAHPERSDQVLERPEIVAELAARGWLLQINATSLLGYHGPSRAGVGWSAVEEGFASLLAAEPVAKLEHASVALGERLESPVERFLLESAFRLLVRKGILPGDEVSEDRVLLLTDRLVETGRRPCRGAHLERLLEGKAGLL